MTAVEPKRLHVIIVAVLSQIGWFAAVLGAAHGLPWAGPLVTALVLPVSGLLLKAPGRVTRLAAMAVGAGLVIETALAVAGLVTYAEPGPFAPLPPLWLLSLWALFALVIETALTALEGRRGVQATLAAVGGPLAYLAGEKLGAMSFLEPRLWGLLALGALWALALPLLMDGRRRLVASSLRRSRQGTLGDL